MKRVLDHDPVTGTTVWHEYDSLTGETTLAEIQDVQPILEHNVALQNHGTAKGANNQLFREGTKKGWVHVGSIPMALLHQMEKRTGISMLSKEALPLIKALLNDPAYKKLRTGTGKI